LCLVEFGIGGDNSIVLLVQSPPCGHLLELLAGWDALQHGCIVNLTGVDNKAFCDPETGSDRLLSAISRELEHPLAQPVAKVICLLQYVKSVHRTAENIAAALHPSAAGDSQLAAVKDALRQLEAANKVRLGDDGYRIPTPAEDHWERIRNGISPKSSTRQSSVPSRIAADLRQL
jgi:hypothetical protein